MMSDLKQFGRSYLTAEVFGQRACRAVERLTTRDVRLRKGPAKRLIEEVWPLAVLLRHLRIPQRTIRCRYVGDTQNFDAKITVMGREVELGLIRSHYFVEVTTAGSRHEYLKREALERRVPVFGGDTIRREGSRARGDDRIVSEPVAESAEAVLERMVQWTTSRLEDKGSKCYPEPCILLVSAEPERPFAMSQWLRVSEQVRDRVAATPFSDVFVVQAARNLVLLLGTKTSMASLITGTHEW